MTKLDDTSQLLYSKVKAIYMKIKDSAYRKADISRSVQAMATDGSFQFSIFVLFLIARTKWPCIQDAPSVKIRASFSRFSQTVL
jgi:hypothetical protein